MLATLEFTLPEEQDEFEAATNAYLYISACEALNRRMREILKYRADLTDKEVEVVTELRQLLIDCLGDLLP